MKVAKFKLAWTETIPAKDRPKISCSRESVEVFKQQYDDSINFQESFYVMLLNRNNRVLGVSLLSTGTTYSAMVDMKYLLSMAFLANACGVVLCHNHPSGQTAPSPQDEQITRRIKDALKLIDVALLDHVILSPEGDYYSFADEGQI
jgi:DNA repair protein RadC